MEPAPNDVGFKQCNSYLHALLISLASSGKDIMSLSYRYNPRDRRSTIIQQTNGVARLILRLGKIRDLKLALFTPSSYFSDAVDQANAELLDAALYKNPHELHLASSSTIHTTTVFGNRKITLDKSYEGRGSNPLLLLRNLRLFDTTKGGSQPILAIGLGTDSELRRLKFDTFPHIFRQFSLDMVRLNRFSLLTHLQLANVRSCGEQDLLLSLLNVQFPCLTHLLIRSCHRGYQKILFDLVARHEGITLLSFQLDNKEGKVACLPVAELSSPPVLQKLQRIGTTPGYAPHFFTSPSSLVSLESVTLQDTFSYFDGENVFFKALTALQSCPTRIELTLYISSPAFSFKRIFENMNSNPSFLLKPSLSCVRLLSLSYQSRDFSDEEITDLPTWFWPFPDLEEVRLEIFVAPQSNSADYSVPKWNKITSKAAAERVKAACPALQKFSVVKGRTKRLAWSFDGENAVPSFNVVA
ncbi:hypothetical protein CVT24_008559 [Panaeolus cyanescens]|uniref:F-box domain-containing protein n=1 Tax=Panaeolus cyanescens TaxID=181874 RepID=A0A409VB64_9AGAR|nr:hypothetical protein CVT24_008559 [Panaeolus cyanescens]